MAKKRLFDSLEKENAAALADMIVNPGTSDGLRVQILNKLLDSTDADNFFETIFGEGLTYGACPECGHENHWGVPEEDLNREGYVTHEIDERVKRATTEADCPVYQEACSKKKVTI
jgi:hypothetical protein